MAETLDSKAVSLNEIEILASIEELEGIIAPSGVVTTAPPLGSGVIVGAPHR